jgi:hypothetical protein
LERDLAGQFEIAVLVAVISQHQVDVNYVPDTNEVAVCLHPRVVCQDGCRGIQAQGRRKDETHFESLPMMNWCIAWVD